MENEKRSVFGARGGVRDNSHIAVIFAIPNPKDRGNVDRGAFHFRSGLLWRVFEGGRHGDKFLATSLRRHYNHITHVSD